MNRTRLGLSAASVVVIAIAVSMSLVSCGRPCTLAGCGDRVGYAIPDEAYVAWGATTQVPVIIETCLDDECRSAEMFVNEYGKPRRIGGELWFDEGTLNLDAVYTVTLKITDPAGTVRYARTDSGVALRKVQPNGPNCDPTCAEWTLALEPEDLGI